MLVRRVVIAGIIVVLMAAGFVLGHTVNVAVGSTGEQTEQPADTGTTTDGTATDDSAASQTGTETTQNTDTGILQLANTMTTGTAGQAGDPLVTKSYIDAEVSKLQSKIDSLKSQADYLRTEVDGLRVEVDNLKAGKTSS